MMAIVCHYALHKLHKLPSEIMDLPDRERAFIIASIRQKVEDDRKELNKAKSRR
ncbi:hypothetical protein PV797_07185 [Clostridiaceae bacterium M8S5]|nr:hypothetical protein PV797_07185 [Clostridiaceae bacterium M8S5]